MLVRPIAGPPVSATIHIEIVLKLNIISRPIAYQLIMATFSNLQFIERYTFPFFMSWHSHSIIYLRFKIATNFQRVPCAQPNCGDELFQKRDGSVKFTPSIVVWVRSTLRWLYLNMLEPGSRALIPAVLH